MTGSALQDVHDAGTVPHDAPGAASAPADGTRAGETPRDAVAPDEAPRDVPAPDVVSRDAPAPDAPARDAATPDSDMPDAATPDVQTPDAATPDAASEAAAEITGSAETGPATEDAPAPPAAIQAIAPPPPPDGVLVVDDSGHSRELLMSMLRRLTNVELRQARSGEDALAEFAARPARLTFLDIDMPGLDGLEVLRRLRATFPDAFVVMVSGVSSVENVRLALAEGAGCFVVKPFRPQRIIDALARYVKETGDRSILIGG